MVVVIRVCWHKFVYYNTCNEQNTITKKTSRLHMKYTNNNEQQYYIKLKRQTTTNICTSTLCTGHMYASDTGSVQGAAYTCEHNNRNWSVIMMTTKTTR